jgi:aldose 1-epimerase
MAPETLIIKDAVSGAQAKILPTLGFNCYSFVAVHSAGPIEVLWSAADFATGAGRPSGSGIPLMFPFAGRIRGTSFRFEGRQYALEAGDGLGNAIHGFVINRPWRVIHQAENRVTGQFHASLDDASLLKHWPADFRITADYQLAGNSLVSEFLVENPDARPLPFGFGTHPYFRVPLGGSSGAECRVTVPVENQWELEGLLPTGRKTSPAITAELSRGMLVGAMKLDSVFSGLKFDNHHCTARVHDPHSRHSMTMTFDDQFTACVVYNPPHREAVCIEPYTTIPDAFTLRDKKIDPGLRILPPGGTFRTRIDIRLD